MKAAVGAKGTAAPIRLTFADSDLADQIERGFSVFSPSVHLAGQTSPGCAATY